MSSPDDRLVPPAAVVGAGLLILVTMTGVGVVQLRKHFAPPAPVAAEPVVALREFRFIDEGDGINAFGGHVRVYDATTGAELAPLRVSDGFIKAVLNSLAFERRKRNLDAAPVFDLVLEAGNRLMFEDPATGAKVNVGAFGGGNRAVFTRLMSDRPRTTQ
jgi:putative photosynthetic complex assembly protein